MQSNTSALPLGNHVRAKTIKAGNAFLNRVAAEPARHVTHVERRGGRHDGGGGTRAAVRDLPRSTRPCTGSTTRLASTPKTIYVEDRP
jgi:hypothetical protein